MVNGIIVTVRMKEPPLELDMEVPCQIPIQTVCVQLLEALKIIAQPSLKSCKRICLWSEGKQLRNDRSLAEMGIWDGGTLLVIPEM